MDAITDLAENLAQSLRRSVAVDDADLRLVASSTHFGDADPLRLVSLANRRIDGPVREATFAAGYLQWRKPRRGRALGIEGHQYDRMAFPLRSRYGLLGVMWVILTDDEDLSEDEMQQCLATATFIEERLALQREMDAEQHTVQMLQSLLCDDADGRRRALEALRGLAVLEHSAHATAMVVMTTGEPVSAQDGLRRIRQIVTQVLTPRWGAAALAGLHDDCIFILLGHRAQNVRAQADQAAAQILQDIRRTGPPSSDRLRLGIGSSAPLTDIRPSLAQARAAAHIAHHANKSWVHWDDHPVESMMLAVTKRDIETQLVPRVITDRVQAQTPEILDTVARYLEFAGSVPQASQRLHVHRTTVYYRLRHFEQQTGLSLADGHHRFLLQLWFQIRASEQAADLRPLATSL